MLVGKKLYSLYKYYYQKVEQWFLLFFDWYIEEEIFFVEWLFWDLVIKWYLFLEEMEGGFYNVFK